MDEEALIDDWINSLNDYDVNTYLDLLRSEWSDGYYDDDSYYDDSFYYDDNEYNDDYQYYNEYEYHDAYYGL